MEQMHKPAPRQEKEEEIQDMPAPNERREEKLTELDDVLDEIDDALEINAEEFVKQYIQKGGQ